MSVTLSHLYKKLVEKRIK